MKRAIALLVLACGLGMQATVPPCPAVGGAPTSSHAEAHADADVGTPAHHSGPTDSSAHRPDGHHGSTCMLMTACGSAGLVVRPPAAAWASAAVARSAPETPPGPAASVCPAHEPPPPRLSI